MDGNNGYSKGEYEPGKSWAKFLKILVGGLAAGLGVDQILDGLIKLARATWPDYVPWDEGNDAAVSMWIATGVGAALMRLLQNWSKESDSFLSDVAQAILTRIKLASVLLCVGMLAGGCAGLTATPQPILDVGRMQGAGLLVLQRDVETSIDALVEVRNNAVRDGYRLFFEAEADKMTDPSGYVLRSEYDAFAADMAEDLEGKIQRNQMEGAAIKARLNASFSDVRQLGQAVQDYNEAQQVTAAAWENLITTGQAGIDTAGQIILDWRAHDLAQSEAAKASNAQRRGSVMQFLSEVQRAVQAGERPNVDWLREAAEALDSGGEIPEFPMTPPEAVEE